MKKLLILLLFLSQICVCSNADNPRDAEGWAISPITVNGLKVLGKYSKKDMIKALGNPSNIIDTLIEGMHCIYFEYQNDSFTLEDGRFTRFELRNPNSKFYINNLIQPGISITVLSKLLADLVNGIGLPETIISKSGDKRICIDVAKNFDAGYINFWYSKDTIDTIVLDHID
ncbi:MAG: hypothetical protein PHY93_19105 [Bacteriovorax sp.]|nr:hypothetical protein [Bacteriovorax sp.]